MMDGHALTYEEFEALLLDAHTAGKNGVDFKKYFDQLRERATLAHNEHQQTKVCVCTTQPASTTMKQGIATCNYCGRRAKVYRRSY